jgi:hypothetical protein
MGLTRRFALIGREKNTKKVKTGVLERAYLWTKVSNYVAARYSP